MNLMDEILNGKRDVIACGSWPPVIPAIKRECELCDGIVAMDKGNIDVVKRLNLDATPELVRVKAQAYVEKYWDAADEKSRIPSMAHVFEGQTKEEVVENFIKDWTQPGSPMIVSVQEDGSYVSA